MQASRKKALKMLLYSNEIQTLLKKGLKAKPSFNDPSDFVALTTVCPK